jgi:twinkle protein
MSKDKEIIGDLPCPQCRDMGRDKTGNHLMVFKNGWKYCNRCGYKEEPDNNEPKPVRSAPQPPKKKVINPNELALKKKEIERIRRELKPADIPDRKISKLTAERFGVKCLPDSRYYPIHRKGKLDNYKKRVLPKKFFLIKPKEDDEAELFGQSAFRSGGKYIIIAGGEEDAMASYEILHAKYPQMAIAHVAPVYGENMFNISKNLEYVMSFENIYLAMDKDTAGEEFKRSIVDLTDMRQKGREREYISAFFNPQRYRPQGLVTPVDIREEAIMIPTYGKPFPWPSLTKATYGRRLGDGYYIGAGVKIGKSEWLNQMVAHILQTESTKAMVAKPEELPKLTAQKIAGKIYAKPFHDPDAYKEGVFSREDLEMAIDSLGDRVIMYNRYGSLDWEELKACIRHATVIEGVEDVFIDPITVFTDGMDSSDADKLLKKIVRDLDNMSKDIGFTFYCFCHLNNPPKGAKPYEEGGRVKSAYFANSRGMMRACQYMIGIERDKYNPDPIIRNTSNMRLLDDRLFGRYVDFPVYYDNDTGEYLERKIDVPF